MLDFFGVARVMVNVNSRWRGWIIASQKGGLGIKDLCSWNQSAILFQLWRVATSADSLWITWVKLELIGNKHLWTMKTPSKCSWCFKIMLNARPLALQHLGSLTVLSSLPWILMIKQEFQKCMLAIDGNSVRLIMWMLSSSDAYVPKSLFTIVTASCGIIRNLLNSLSRIYGIPSAK